MIRNINIKIHKEAKYSSQITMRTGAKNGEKNYRKLSGIKKLK